MTLRKTLIAVTFFTLILVFSVVYWLLDHTNYIRENPMMPADGLTFDEALFFCEAAGRPDALRRAPPTDFPFFGGIFRRPSTGCTSAMRVSGEPCC